MLDDELYGRFLDSLPAVGVGRLVLNLTRVESETRQQFGRRGITFDEWGRFSNFKESGYGGC